MHRVVFSAIGLVLLLGAIQGCASSSAPGGRESSVTVYGTVDAGVSVTRDK
ncbi:hypothetical protein ACUXAV_003339 [Cupriavidus metallidurans]|uniref:hypothetical protein n=1 Tax=Cupriavidus TaxID=106589 RepID=UPI0002FE5AF6|nr:MULTISPECIES: hypothetical protein [Cupriavidus]KWW35011.1 hypothetical protein AU374_03885 [Cupriavidus metallidurans]MDE4922218.1 hypothetical protein [Cupriavidus metallidurans]QWC90724.1 hypothetical protein KB891_24680 [Cupriavidus metallidurans]